MAARAKRKPSGYQLDPSLPYAIYWGNEALYGKVYLIIGREAKSVALKQAYAILNRLYKPEEGKIFLNNWPIPGSFFSKVTELKTKECLTNFLSTLEIESSPDGSDSELPTALVASNA